MWLGVVSCQVSGTWYFSATTRHRRDMTEKLLKATLNPNTQGSNEYPYAVSTLDSYTRSNQRSLVSLTWVLRICQNQRLLRKRSLNIALGQGQKTHKDQNFDVNRNASSLWSFVASLKKSLQPLTSYTSFHDLINVYSCRSEADNPRGQFFLSTETSCHFGPLLQVSLKSDFIHFFNDFIHVYSPGAWADNPLRKKFWCQQEHLVT